jgi:hypothetical protein
MFRLMKRRMPQSFSSPTTNRKTAPNAMHRARARPGRDRVAARTASTAATTASSAVGISTQLSSPSIRGMSPGATTRTASKPASNSRWVSA